MVPGSKYGCIPALVTVVGVNGDNYFVRYDSINNSHTTLKSYVKLELWSQYNIRVIEGTIEVADKV